MPERRTFGKIPFLALVTLAALGGFYVYANKGKIFGTRRRRTRSPCASNLKQIGYALHLYSADHDEAFPVDLSVLFEQKYLKDMKVFICPTAARRITRVFGCSCSELPDGYESYCYVSGTSATDPPDFIAAFDVESNHSDHNGVNVLFIGGNVEWRNDLDELHDLLGKQRLEMAARGRTMKIIRPAWSEAPPDGLSRR